MKYKIKDIIESQDYNKIPSRFLFKYFFIPTAWPITLILLNLRISANQATLIRLIIHLVAFFFILIKFSVLGYILIYVAIIFDCVDGQIARTKNTATFFGKFLDGWIDCIFEILFVLYIAIAISYREQNIMPIAMLASMMNAFYWLTLIRFSLNIKNKNNYKFNKIERKIFKFLDNRLLVDWFDIKYFIFPFFVFFNLEKQFIYFLLIVNSLLFLIISLQKIYIGYFTLNVHKRSYSSKDHKKK